MWEELEQLWQYIFYRKGKMTSPVEIWRRHKSLNKFLNKKGKVLSWTKIMVAPLGFEHMAPYFVGIVELDPSTGSGQGEKVTVQIVDCEEDQIKTNLEVVTIVRKGEKPESDEVIEYSIKVKPL